MPAARLLKERREGPRGGAACTEGWLAGAPTYGDLHVSNNPLRQTQGEGLGPQPCHSLHHLVPEAEQRLRVLQGTEVGSRHCQDDVVRSQLSPGTWVFLDTPLPLLLGCLSWEERPWGLKLTFLNPFHYNMQLEPQKNIKVMNNHVPSPSFF